jgi:hypothetical protein
LESEKFGIRVSNSGFGCRRIGGNGWIYIGGDGDLKPRESGEFEIFLCEGEKLARD